MGKTPDQYILRRLLMSGFELKCTRLKARIPQYKLAAYIGITQTELSAYENQHKLLSQEIVEQIKEAIRNWKDDNPSIIVE
jgi:hypothetical protein